MADELLDIVNEDDEVTHQEMRSVVHQHGLWHRGAHVFLFDENGDLLVQKRSADRIHSPSLLDCSVSEHVKAGESYQAAALRGLREEMGVTGITLTPLVKFRMNYGLNDNEVSALYTGTVNPAAVNFDPVEISEISYRNMDELRSLMESQPDLFCGWFIQILKWYWSEPANMSVYKDLP